MCKIKLLILFLSAIGLQQTIYCMIEEKKNLLKNHTERMQQNTLAFEKTELNEVHKKIDLEKEALKNSWKNLKSGGFCNESPKIIGHIFTLYIKLYPNQEQLQAKIERRKRKIKNCD